MGDKSPKSVHKQAAQKQTKNDAVMRKKDEIEAARQTASAPKNKK